MEKCGGTRDQTRPIWARCACLLLCEAWCAAASLPDLSQPSPRTAKKYSVGAFYYGPWHVDPTNEMLHGKNWTEWNLVKSAQPRFPGHLQPNVPLWGYEMDNDPAVMAKKIDAAADNGIDHFLFDWYWYNETSTNGQLGLFQDSALEKGFLSAPNRHRLDFALMWASQEWMDVHPAVGPSVKYEKRAPTFNGAINRETFERMTNHIVSSYFSQPNYLRVENQHGEDKCAFFSIYDVPTFVSGQGGIKQARAALDAFRAKAKAAGEECLHISTQGGAGSVDEAQALGLDSAANYCWYHTTGNVLNAPANFPVTPHAAMLKGSVQAWKDMTAKWGAAGFRYIPNLSVQWDSSPRTVATDTFQLGVYPFTGTFRSTPEEWTTALQAGKQFLDQNCPTNSSWCPITINAW